MKKSLQDQLIKAGLSNKQQARQINTAKKKNKGKITDSPDTGNAHAARLEQAEKDRQRNLALAQAAEEKARQVQILQLIESNKVSVPKRGMPYYFLAGNKLKKIIVDERTRIQLAFGQLGIVEIRKALEPHYLLVPDTTLHKLRERNSQAMIVWAQSPSSLAEYLTNHGMEDWSYPKDIFT